MSDRASYLGGGTTAPFTSAATQPGYDQASIQPINFRSAHIDIRLAIDDLERLAQEYLLDCEYRQHKPHTIQTNRNFLQHLFHYLRSQGYTACGKLEIKQFLHYIQQPPEPGGRWGNPRLKTAVRPITARGYHRCYATFFKWLVEEEYIPVSPMAKIPAPSIRGVELKQPLNDEQVAALLEAAKQAQNPRRAEALLLMLLDTGLRAAELCNLKLHDADFQNRSAKVLGKGNKIRVCYWSVATAKALSRYLRYETREPNDPIFTSDGGTLTGEALTPSGLYRIMRKLGEKAGVKCGCHDWRRTFAVSMLKGGANLISVQRLMGHETLAITQGYLNLAEADVENQHREFSPVERLRKGRK